MQIKVVFCYFSYISFEDMKLVLYPLLGIVYFILIILAGLKHRNKTDSNFTLLSIDSEIVIWSTQFLLLNNKEYVNEIEFFYRYFKKKLNLIYSKDIRKQLIFNLKNRIDTTRASKINSDNASHKDRLHLIYFLFELASVTKPVTENELNFIVNLSKKLKISSKIFNRVKYKFIQADSSKESFINFSYSAKNIEFACNILGVPTNATYRVIKKAYRKLVQKYHPDKVSQYGEDAIRDAEIQFLKIKEAYELLKTRRKK